MRRVQSEVCVNEFTYEFSHLGFYFFGAFLSDGELCFKL